VEFDVILKQKPFKKEFFDFFGFSMLVEKSPKAGCDRLTMDFLRKNATTSMELLVNSSKGSRRHHY
jgi:hypothetical protein